MTPQTKIRIANLTMLVGISPFLLGIVWMCYVISYAKAHPGEMGGSDGFLMIFVLLVTYVFALAVSAPGAHWSARLVKQAGTSPAPVAKALRIIVLVILVGPLLAYAALVVAPLLAWL